MDQCQALTDGVRGRRCSRKAVAGQQLCSVHKQIADRFPGQLASLATLTPGVINRNFVPRDLQQLATLNLDATSSGTFSTPSFGSSQHQQQQTTTFNSSLTAFSFGNPQPTSVFGNASTGFSFTTPKTSSAGHERISEPNRPAFGLPSINSFGRSEITATTNGFGQPAVLTFGASSSSNLGVPSFGPSQQQPVPALNSSSTLFSFGSQQPARILDSASAGLFSVARPVPSLGSAGSGLFSNTAQQNRGLFGGSSSSTSSSALPAFGANRFGQPQQPTSISNSNQTSLPFGQPQPQSTFSNCAFRFVASQSSSIFDSNSSTSFSALPAFSAPFGQPQPSNSNPRPGAFRFEASQSSSVFDSNSSTSSSALPAVSAPFGQPQPQSSNLNPRPALFGFAASQSSSIFENQSTTSTSTSPFGRSDFRPFGPPTQTTSLSVNSSGDLFGRLPPTSLLFSFGESDERAPDNIDLMLPD